VLGTRPVDCGSERYNEGFVWEPQAGSRAVLAGAFGLSSNRADARGGYGGLGWIIDPDGRTIAITTHEQPIITAQIDLAQAERARSTHPRNVFSPKGAAPGARQNA